MNNSGDIDLLTAFKKLLADNKSQEVRLQETTKILNSRENEIEVLQAMLSEANEYRSSIDNQLIELKELRDYISDLQRHVSSSGYIVQSGQRPANLKPTYAYMQSQLAELQTQLLEVNRRNLLLQQQTNRIAELESLLANADTAKGKTRVNVAPWDLSR